MKRKAESEDRQPEAGGDQDVLELKDSTEDEVVTRFEVPFDLECKGCHSVAAKGVRVDAIRKAVGIYHTGKIWSYIMKCGYCGEKIVMDRFCEDSKYKVIEGATKKKLVKQETVAADAAAVNQQQPWTYGRLPAAGYCGKGGGGNLGKWERPDTTFYLNPEWAKRLASTQSERLSLLRSLRRTKAESDKRVYPCTLSNWLNNTYGTFPNGLNQVMYYNDISDRHHVTKGVI